MILIGSYMLDKTMTHAIWGKKIWDIALFPFKACCSLPHLPYCDIVVKIFLHEILKQMSIIYYICDTVCTQFYPFAKFLKFLNKVFLFPVPIGFPNAIKDAFLKVKKNTEKTLELGLHPKLWIF